MNLQGTNYRSEADVAFEMAIAAGRLSREIGAPNYAGDYMYMGRSGGRMVSGTHEYPKDHFKHRDTRKYLP